MARSRKKIVFDPETPDGTPKNVTVVSENGGGRMVHNTIEDVEAIVMPRTLAMQMLDFLIRHNKQFTIANRTNSSIWINTDPTIMTVINYLFEREKRGERPFADMTVKEFLEKLFDE